MEAAASRQLWIWLAFWWVGLGVTAVSGKEIVDPVLGGLYAPHWHLLVIGWIGYGVYYLA